jgi:CheY-specific phosphatase CheX
MAVRYIEPFIDATVAVFKELFQVTAEVQKPYLVKPGDPHNWDVSAIIGLAGDARGAVVLSFTDSLAFELTASLEGGSASPPPDLVTDTIAWPTRGIPIIGVPFKTTIEPFHLSVGLENIITYE